MTPSRTSSGRFSRLLFHTELRPVFPLKSTSGCGVFSKRSSRILTPASIAMSGFCGLPVPSFFNASGSNHVVDGYEPPRARASNRREVYPQLLRLTPGGVCGPRHPGCLLSLLGRLPNGVLGLLGGLPRSVLHALRHLPYLVGDSAHKTSDTTLLLAAAGEPAYCVLDALGGLSGLIGDLADGVLSLAGYLSDLVRGLSCHLLGLTYRLARGVLRRRGRLPRGTVTRDFGPSHSLGRLYHVTYDDASVGARALDLREIHAQLPCLASGRVRGLNLPLTPDLVRVQVGDVLLCLVD